MLLNVARLDSEKIPESLSLIHRIAFGMGYLETHDDLSEEFVAVQTLSYKQLDDIIQLFKNTDEKLMLVLECMLLVGMFDKGKKDAVEYVAKLSELLELTKENLVFLSNMAAAVLTQNLDSYKCNIRNELDIFECYLSIFKFRTKIIYSKIPTEYKELDFLKCKNIELDSGVLKMVCRYGHWSFWGDELKTITMEVPENFILLANCENIKPEYPIGAVVAHPLIRMSEIRKEYGDAVNKYKEENKTNEN